MSRHPQHALTPRRSTSRNWLVGALVAGLVGAALIADGTIGTSPVSAAQSSVGLGTATSFAVLAGQTVTNTGSSVISGDVGVSPGTAITGFPPGVVTGGTQHAADAVALQAQSDLTTAFDDAAGRTPPTVVPADLGGLTLVPGVYKAPSALGLTGTVTLNANGDAGAVFIFQVGSTLITASNSMVNLIGSAQACNVFWQIGSSATLGTNTTFVGSILALSSASVQTGTTVSGRVLARNGQVSLDDNVITRPGCAAATPTSTPSTSTSTSTSATATASETSTGGSTVSPSAPPTSPGVVGVGPPTGPPGAASSPPNSLRRTPPPNSPRRTPTPTSTRSGTRLPGSTPPATGPPTPTDTRGPKAPGPPGPRTHYPIPPGFPQTGMSEGSPEGDGNNVTLITAGTVALLAAAIAAGQAARRRKGIVRPE